MTIFTPQSSLDPALIMKQIDEEFVKLKASGSGGGVSEAPIDQNIYCRGQGTWVSLGALQVQQPIAPSGPSGPSGPAGPQGPPGISMTAGSGAPSATMPVGTLYLDSVTGDLYQFS